MQHNRSVLPYASFRPDVIELEDQISELIAHISAATYRLLVLIREFDEKEGWHGPGL